VVEGKVGSSPIGAGRRATVPIELTRDTGDCEIVDRDSRDSFPASDPPSWTPVMGSRSPRRPGSPSPQGRTAERERAMTEFLTDIKKIRERARRHLEDGAVTEGYKADRKRVLAVLNEVLATELVCVLRYKRHYFMARGIHAEAVKSEFLQHAGEEQQHADWVAERITQLGGEPDFNPEGLAGRSHSEYVSGADLTSMIREDLVAERIAIETYSEIARWLGQDDPTTRKLIEDILKVEEEHADDMANLLVKMAGA
jgi:bacterioferritin